MLQKFLIVWAGLIVGVFVGYFLIYKIKITVSVPAFSAQTSIRKPKKQIVGFLPFWLINRASADYSKYINTLNYFNLSIDSNGTLIKYDHPGELNPGWLALSTDKVDSYLMAAKQKGMDLSLTVFSSDDEKIDKMLEDPITSGQNLVNDITPILKQYSFSNLNLDVEKVSDASPEARLRFAQFVGEIKKGLDFQKSGTLTIDISPIAFIKNTNLVDPREIATNVDYVILMAYDYHNPGSFVTGPVSPETGAGITSEFDTESAVFAALSIIPADKLILGIPLYGYQWESINPAPRSAVIPGTSIITSNLKAEEFLANCASCSAEFDKTDQESHVIYKDADTGTYHQIFYPNQISTMTKVNFAKNNNLEGMAVWALGYEGPTIMTPLSGFLH